MRLGVHHVMDRKEKIEERLELALRSAEPPTLEEVLEQVSTHGVLRGPVDWVFPAWMLYVEYATQRIAETFPLSEEERRQLLDFRDTLTRLLREAWMQAKKKLTTLHKAVAEGTYRVEGKRLYTPDGTWMYVREKLTPRITIRGVCAKAYFPDILKLPLERLELFQLGWRASDEGELMSRPYMDTSQPWQAFAWAAARYGKLHVCIISTNLTREGVSVAVHLRANSWRQRWSRAEAADLAAGHLRRGEWAPLLTMWLGDGSLKWREYRIVIATKEPWRLGISIGTGKALVATGKEMLAKLREAASVYGELLDLLRAYKWIYIKLATDDGFRATYKLNKKGVITVAGVVMHLRLINGRSGSLYAEYYTRDLEKARAVAKRLKEAGLRPNIMRIGPNYVVYITMTGLSKLAKRDEVIRKAVALYLAEKTKNGTPRQREFAKKILNRNPFFRLSLCLIETGVVSAERIIGDPVSRWRLASLADGRGGETEVSGKHQIEHITSV